MSQLKHHNGYRLIVGEEFRAKPGEKELEFVVYHPLHGPTKFLSPEAYAQLLIQQDASK